MPWVCNALQERLLGAADARRTGNGLIAEGGLSQSDGQISEQSSDGVADGSEQGLGEAVLYFGCRRRDQVRIRAGLIASGKPRKHCTWQPQQ